MQFIQLTIKGISYSQVQTGAYALILEDNSTNKKLPIIIGAFEAQSIAIALESDVASPRPLTHDLFVTIASKFNINLLYILIHKLEEGVFYSNIVFKSSFNSEEVVVDSRTSDAIAIAIRFNAPIYTYSEIVTKAGIDLQLDKADHVSDFQTKEENSSQENYKSISELKKEIEEAIANEDYERAAKLRDELSKKI